MSYEIFPEYVNEINITEGIIEKNKKKKYYIK